MAAHRKRHGSPTAAHSPSSRRRGGKSYCISSKLRLDQKTARRAAQSCRVGIALASQCAHNTLWMKRATAESSASYALLARRAARLRMGTGSSAMAPTVCALRAMDKRRRGRRPGEFAMTDDSHKFKVGQTVDLVPSTFRSAANGSYEIVGLRAADNVQSS